MRNYQSDVEQETLGEQIPLPILDTFKIGDNFTSPVRQTPYLIITRKLSTKCNIKLTVINGGKPPTPINSIPVYYNDGILLKTFNYSIAQNLYW